MFALSHGASLHPTSDFATVICAPRKLPTTHLPATGPVLLLLVLLLIVAALEGWGELLVLLVLQLRHVRGQ